MVKLQKEIKRYANRNRKEAEKYKVKDRILISTKDFSMELMNKVMMLWQLLITMTNDRTRQ